MIRVNLLPTKRDAKRGLALGGGDASQAWLLFVLGAVVLEAVVLIVFHKSKLDELAKVNAINTQIQAKITDIQRQTANHAEITAQLKELRDREDAIAKLQAGRTGPTATMLELSRVLTSGRGPTVDRDRLEQLRRDDPQAVPNPNWDPRRLWLEHYEEADRVVKLEGLARDGEDVSELLRRLALSDYFGDLKLLPAEKVNDSATHMELLKFQLSAKVRY